MIYFPGNTVLLYDLFTSNLNQIFCTKTGLSPQLMYLPKLIELRIDGHIVKANFS